MYIHVFMCIYIYIYILCIKSAPWRSLSTKEKHAGDAFRRQEHIGSTLLEERTWPALSQRLNQRQCGFRLAYLVLSGAEGAAFNT